uniref:Putative secreted peptide n=1 Tax=Anopheles braziliensis TaxID=58242 RepID=A0A2M3ZT52_9DIPT
MAIVSVCPLAQAVVSAVSPVITSNRFTCTSPISRKSSMISVLPWPAAAIRACWAACSRLTSVAATAPPPSTRGNQSHATRYLTTFSRPAIAACTKAHRCEVSVCPRQLPAATSCRTTSQCPFEAASISGVQPWLFVCSTLAPNSSNRFTIGRMPS